MVEADKSPQAYRTISEVAAELRVETHVLRYWETQFSQIKPMKRKGGRRYYNAQDVAKIQEIKSLLYDRGFTIRGARDHLRKAHGPSPADTAAPSPQKAPAPQKKAMQTQLAALHRELCDLRKLSQSANH